MAGPDPARRPGTRPGRRKPVRNSERPVQCLASVLRQVATGEIDEAARSNFLWTLGQVAQRGGLPDRALAAAAEEKRDLDRKRGADCDAAGLIADILMARSDFDEALRIRREEQLPVFERLGDVRERAVAQGRIADILEARGEFAEALRMRTEEELPVFERLGDAR